jgi:acylphosphatase
MIVQGRVQGVFFRANTKEKADLLGLKGWARNLRSGEVEIVVQGEIPKLENFIEWCREGPMRARVSDIKVDFEDIKEEFEEFKIKK